jgi:hypothetical protein
VGTLSIAQTRGSRAVALAWKDDEFRAKFLGDPKAQFEEKPGTKLPAALVMTAHAEDENHLHFVIPARPKREPLSDVSWRRRWQ